MRSISISPQKPNHKVKQTHHIHNLQRHRNGSEHTSPTVVAGGAGATEVVAGGGDGAAVVEPPPLPGHWYSEGHTHWIVLGL